MNLITHNTAYSIFPQGTFKNIAALSLLHRESDAKHDIEKYKSRRWTIRNTVNLDKVIKSAAFSFRQEMQYLENEYCWSMLVLPKIDSVHPYSIKSNSWLVKYDEQRSINLLYKMVKSNRLQFKYIILGDSGANNDEMKVLEESLKEEIKHRNTDEEKYLPFIHFFWIEVLLT